jgi:hypothetical protein
MNPRLSSVETAMPSQSPAAEARGTHPRGLAQGIAAAVHGCVRC